LDIPYIDKRTTEVYNNKILLYSMERERERDRERERERERETLIYI
jgi:hypothetical protein